MTVQELTSSGHQLSCTVDKRPFEVTEPFLPPLDELLPSLRQMWDSKRLSNGGPFHREFEEKLADYLGVSGVALCSSGSFALLAALDALELSGEVITTPLSFIATAHALHWKGIRPVFADIDPDSFTLDPHSVEARITPETTAILGVHLFGRPCRSEALQEIADRYGLRLIFDAAHAFGVADAGGSILRYGDLSIVSFHATKVFTTFEGGAVICNTPEMYSRVDRFRNFGGKADGVEGFGFNGKMNEFQAALGILQLRYVDDVIRRRGEIDALYRRMLAPVRGLWIQEKQSALCANGGYFPVLVGADALVSRDEVYDALRRDGIMVRRYFHPLISNSRFYRDLPSSCRELLPVANTVSGQILCLPIHTELSHQNIQYIAHRIGELIDGK